MKAGHRVVVHDVSAEAVRRLAREGGIGAASLRDFVDTLARPRHVWLMVLSAMRHAFGGHLERRG